MFESSLIKEIDEWQGQGLYTQRVPELDAWIFCALHDRRLGPPTGGTRLRVYDQPRAGVVDALRLSRGMTHKWAAVELPFGGAKAVLCLSRELSGPDERKLLLETYAATLRNLGESFGTGQDLGTTPQDMHLLARLCNNIHGIDPETGEVEDPGPHTAHGVHEAMKSALTHRYGSSELEGRTVLIEGVGDVGRPLARRLAAEGARLLLVDLDRMRAEELASELGGEALGVGPHLCSPCEIYAPCATGATLGPESVPILGCAIVCGSANNQLAEVEAASRLHARGILYTPDFIANAGGAAYCSGLGTGTDVALLEKRVLRIGELVSEVLIEARERDESPHFTAQQRVERFLADHGHGDPRG